MDWYEFGMLMLLIAWCGGMGFLIVAMAYAVLTGTVHYG